MMSSSYMPSFFFILLWSPKFCSKIALTSAGRGVLILLIHSSIHPSMHPSIVDHNSSSPLFYHKLIDVVGKLQNKRIIFSHGVNPSMRLSLKLFWRLMRERAHCACTSTFYWKIEIS